MKINLNIQTAKNLKHNTIMKVSSKVVFALFWTKQLYPEHCLSAGILLLFL